MLHSSRKLLLAVGLEEPGIGGSMSKLLGECHLDKPVRGEGGKWLSTQLPRETATWSQGEPGTVPLTSVFFTKRRWCEVLIS